MDVASFTFSTVSLISAVLDIFRLITSFRSFSDSSTILFRQLELEREVLSRWAKEVGLYPPSEDERSTPTSAIPSDLLPLVHKIVSTIGLMLIKATSSGEKKNIAELDVSSLRVIIESLEFEIDEQQRSHNSRLSRSLKRMGWVFGEEDRLKELISAIHGYNTSLHNLIPKPVQLRLDGSLLHVILSQADPETLREIQDASRSFRKELSVVAQVATLQRTALPSTTELILQRSGLLVLSKDMARYMTSYEKKAGNIVERIDVLVEWRASEMRVNSSERQQHLNTCLDLARLLHASQNFETYRTMDCIGIIDDVEFGPHPRVGLVHRVPTIISEPSFPFLVFTFHDLLNGKEFIRPRLDKRFELARSLSVGLHRLFVSRWYHKNLNSKNIIFFIRAPAENMRIPLDENITRPFLCGFEYARPDSPDQQTIKPNKDEFCDRYRHPECTHPDRRERIRYSRRFDIYSLGVLLIEIGRWETVDKIHADYIKQKGGKQKNAASVSFEAFQKYLQNNCVETLGFRMGKIYSDAVKFCTDNGANERSSPTSSPLDGGHEEQLVENFNKSVVSELARCIV